MRRSDVPRPMSASELQLVIRQERLEGPFLIHRDAAGELRLTSLQREGPLTVGRRPSCDVPIAWDEEVSRTHAILEPVGGEWTVSDDGLSRNGTFVNGERLRARRRLRDGDVVRVGRSTIAYRLPIEGASAATAEAQGAEAVPLSDSQRAILVALCRPYASGGFAIPASNQEVADEVHLSVDAVKNHLRVLYQRFEIGHLAQNRKRARLAECALKLGLVTERDL